MYSFFAEYGRIMDIVALKTRKMRGQAHVVFTDLASATNAVRTANGAMLYGRPMVRCCRGCMVLMHMLHGESILKQEVCTNGCWHGSRWHVLG